MGKIDEVYTRRPFYGYPRITYELNEIKKIIVNHKRVYRLMKIMGLQAIFPKKNLSRPNPAHEIYPYLLNDLVITYPNQVWSVDITYVRLKGDWLYLFAVLDWYSRYVLSWELSDSLSSDFCCEALKRALTINVPAYHNSDQGSQLTGKDYLGILKTHPQIKISMDHKGRCFDNIFVERLWRSVKYEEIYLKNYETPREARESLTEYFNFYNIERPHKSLKQKTPAKVYFDKSLKV